MTETPGSGSESPPFRLRWRRASPTDLKWEEKAEQLEFEALTRVRSAAEKWAASLGAILGLFGTVMLVKGREDITELTSAFEVLVGVALVLALVTAAVALYLAALAAQGTPKEVAWPSGSLLRKWEHQQAVKAKERMKWSRWLTGAAVVLLALAVGMTWYGDTDDSTDKSSSVIMVRASDPAVCGKLAVGPGNALQIQPAKGAAVPLEGAHVSALAVVDGCP